MAALMMKLRSGYTLNNIGGCYPAFMLIVILLLLVRNVPAQTNVVVVANKDSSIAQLSREEVSMLFLGKSKSSNDVPVMIIDSENQALRDSFYLGVANMNSLRLKAYWSRIVFSGQGRPPKEVPISEARARIEKNLEVLTYLPANQVSQKMKIVFRLPEVSFLDH
ncbi:MAG: hypothetical protein ACU85E_12045 [Gammaproteobacteria bacterium]